MCEVGGWERRSCNHLNGLAIKKRAICGPRNHLGKGCCARFRRQVCLVCLVRICLQGTARHVNLFTKVHDFRHIPLLIVSRNGKLERWQRYNVRDGTYTLVFWYELLLKTAPGLRVLPRSNKCLPDLRLQWQGFIQSFATCSREIFHENRCSLKTCSEYIQCACSAITAHLKPVRNTNPPIHDQMADRSAYFHVGHGRHATVLSAEWGNWVLRIAWTHSSCTSALIPCPLP